MTACLALVVALAACGRKEERPRYVPGTAKAVLGVDMAQVRLAVATRLDSGKAPSWVAADRWKRTRALYKVFNDAPLWLETEGLKDRADALLKAIEQAPAHALATDGYPLDSIRFVVNADNLKETAGPQALADADVLLTAAYVAYASDMLMGQVDPKTVSQAWHIPMQTKEVDSALVRTLQSPSMIEGLTEMEPQDSTYRVLVDAYARYKQIDAAGGWPTVPAGNALRPGAPIRLARLEALRRRLSIEGYLPDSGTVATTYDQTLSAAVKLFQERHGLAPSGVLATATTAEMNVPAADRVKQIASNLERQRWLPRRLGSRYIYVNVPAFRVEAYDSGQKKLEMKVVVGAEYQGRSTPVFSDSMEFVVFRPYWNVPDGIAAKEIWPKAKADPGYLERGNYEVYNDHGKQRVRQRPGEKNSLGLVKFMFPNDFNIYLHDTPQKALFKEADRAASHGCIRLERPQDMAKFVLGWDDERIRQSMEEGGGNRTVNLPRKIPVYIVYFTAYARDGQLYFGDDVYGRDDALEESQVTDSATVQTDTGVRTGRR